MNTLLHRDGDDDLDERTGRQDREITLGTTLILGIFLALAVLCAVFFGFGYSMGHKAVTTPAAVTADGSGSGTFSGFKPSPGNPIGSAPNNANVTVQPMSTTVAPLPTGASSALPRNKPVAAPDASADDAGAADVTVPVPASRPQPVVAAVPTTSIPTVAGGSALVQIAAVSHQEDADLLVTTLRRRGYNVAVRSESQDKLLHVQVGPFGSRKDAEAMRQRLLGDGFNAIVKDAH